ncbi:MAG: hypothetical protein EOP45_21395 [Sphingobacteriaceae bacterium]|nr:MAG: hypothetical protein EOP45_21395 [Sphingobacteriaceae bacterium]
MFYSVLMSILIKTASGEEQKVWTNDPYTAQKEYMKHGKAEEIPPPEYKNLCYQRTREYIKRKYAEESPPPEFRKAQIASVKRSQEKARLRKLQQDVSSEDTGE